MPDPEILRRCHACGAAYRPGALFCPQCGNAVSLKSTAETTGNASENNPDEHVAERPMVAAPQPDDARGQKKSSLGLTAEQIEQNILASYEAARRKMALATAKKERTPAAADASSIGDTQSLTVPDAEVETFHSPPVRDVPEPPGESGIDKLRRVSSVVIGEATYDPSFRFIVVAAILFVLFLLVLVLSKIVT
jgi:uncharacterized Zn finger protein (UPF0148 family)